MSCKDCFRRFFFLIISIITIGATAAVLLYAIILINQKNLNTIDKNIIIIVVIAFCISVVALIFSIIASTCGRNCTNVVLAFVFLIYTVFLVLIGVFVLAYQHVIESIISKAFGSTDNSTMKIISAIEDGFNCIGWGDNDNRTEGEKDCKFEFESFYGKYKIVIAVIAFIVAFILVIATILAFKYACCSVTDEEEITASSKVKEQLTYGW